MNLLILIKCSAVKSASDIIQTLEQLKPARVQFDAFDTVILLPFPQQQNSLFRYIGTLLRDDKFTKNRVKANQVAQSRLKYPTL